MNQPGSLTKPAFRSAISSVATLLLGAYLLLMPCALAQAPPQGSFTMEQTLSDGAQSSTLAFDGLAIITGNLAAQSFFPPGKVADYTGFQFLRDNDPDNMGHNTSFLTRVANNVIFVLNDEQLARLKTLAVAQQEQIDLYGYKRYPLMKAFRRLLDRDLPSGTTGLDLAAVKRVSRELYLIDGQISFDRALLYANILSSMSPAQKAYLDAMKGKGWSSWPNITDDQIRAKMSALPRGTAVAVMTYASDLFSWYAGSLEADVYFCPERHGTYYGGFYIKDAPAVGHEGYSISEQLTAEAGRALLDSSLGYVTDAQAALMQSLVDTQRSNLYAGSTNIVQLRTQIATLLRGLMLSTASSDVVKAQVLELSGLYGDLDGENNYAYATVFAQVHRSLGDAQKTKMAALRKSIMSGTYADGTPFDYSTCTTPFLYSAVISDTTVLEPYIANTDYLFSAGGPEIAFFTATPSSIPAGGSAVLSWGVSGATTVSIDNGVGDVSGMATKSVSPSATTTYTLTATNSAGSSTARATITMAAPGCTLAVEPGNLSVASGATATATISCGSVQPGFTTPLTLTVSGAPEGVSVSAAPTSLVPGTGRSTVTVSAAATAAAGSATLRVRAAGGSLTQTVAIPLTITAPASFSLGLAATSLSVQPGASGTTTVTTTHTGAFNAPISLSATGAPGGVNVTFAPAALAAPGDGSSTLTVAAASSAANGTYKLTIQATGGGQTKTQVLTLTIQPAPGFNFSASPQKLSLVQGVSGTAKVTVSGVVGGFSSAVTLNATLPGGSPLPAGLSAAFAPSSFAAPGSGTSTLTLTANRSLAAGTYALTLTASGGGLTRTAAVTLVVTAAPSFTLKASPASLSVRSGDSVSAQISSTSTGGFQAPVSLAAGTLPPGVTVTFLPATINSNGGRTAMKIQTAGTTPAGSYQLTITGTCAGVPPSTVPITLVVAN